MGNKGFAVTSVIYGLAILGTMIIIMVMGTLSSTRNKIKSEAESVEEMLLNYNQSVATITSNKTYKARVAGWYRVEAFGGSCGTKLGAYTTGIIYLEKNKSLTINVGTCGNATTIKSGTSTLMRAGSATTNDVGGTFTCQKTASKGGRFKISSYNADFTLFRTEEIPLSGGEKETKIIEDSPTTPVSLIGNEAVVYETPSTNCTSYISGYASSSPVASGAGNYFLDGMMLPATSEKGKVVFNYIGEETTAPIRNKKFENVSSIRIDTTLGVSAIYYSYRNGTSKQIGTISSPSKRSFLSVGGTRTIDEITVQFTDKKVNTKDVRIYFNNTSTTIYNGQYGGQTTGAAGIHISAYQPDSTASGYGSEWNDISSFPPHGNYYLIPITTEGRVVSSLAADEVFLTSIDGSSSQKWAIDLISSPTENKSALFQKELGNESGLKEYRIMEAARYNSLTIAKDENMPKNIVSTSQNFNTLSRNNPQIWNIIPLGDGTYGIKTVVTSQDTSKRSGFLTAFQKDPNGGEAENYENQVLIGLASNPTGLGSDKQVKPTTPERFILYALDFSK